MKQAHGSSCLRRITNYRFIEGDCIHPSKKWNLRPCSQTTLSFSTPTLSYYRTLWIMVHLPPFRPKISHLHRHCMIPYFISHQVVLQEGFNRPLVSGGLLSTITRWEFITLLSNGLIEVKQSCDFTTLPFDLLVFASLYKWFERLEGEAIPLVNECMALN